MLAVTRPTDRGLSIYNPATLSGISKMLRELIVKLDLDPDSDPVELRRSDTSANFWYMGLKEDAKKAHLANPTESSNCILRQLAGAYTWAPSYEQALTILYVTYCWE